LHAPLGEPWACPDVEPSYGTIGNQTGSEVPPPDSTRTFSPIFAPDEDESNSSYSADGYAAAAATSGLSFWKWSQTTPYGVGYIVVGKVLTELSVGMYGRFSKNTLRTRALFGPAIQTDMMVQCRFMRYDQNCSDVEMGTKWFTDTQGEFVHWFEHDLGYHYYSNFNVWLRSTGLPGKYLHLKLLGFGRPAVRSKVFLCSARSTRCQFKEA
jgi:hypothetical protein